VGDVAAQMAELLAKRGVAFEILLVNDDSKDKSWARIEEAARARPEVRGFSMMRNFGQHNALLFGVRQARFDVVLTMDDDLQHPPEEAMRLLDALEPGVDVVYGTPTDEPHGLMRGLASRFTKLALKTAMGAETARRVSAFRAFRTHIRDASAAYSGPFVNLDVLLTWGTTRFSHLIVRHEPRKVGTSNYTVGKLITHAANMITGFSTLPLQIATMLGFALTFFGMVVLALVVIRYFLDGTAPAGFPFLASMIAIFSGAQLFALGMIGEYLARVHFRLMNRPTYAVREGTERKRENG
jgi:undecaprenyl-phosphate 4-deoxy-4-formamido-L-arabinose transferase